MGFLSVLFRNIDYTNINGSQLQNILNSNRKILILDVRNSEEYRNGHIPNSVNIPVDILSTKLSTLSSYRNNEIVVYCSVGIRSATASEVLARNGFNKIYNLDGGISSYKGKLTKY